MSRNNFYIAIGLIGSTFILLMLILFLPKNSSKKSVQPNQATTIIPSPTTQIKMPVDIHDSSVSSISVVYTFTGSITEINPVPEGFEVITNITTPNIPRFTICITCSQPTQVFGTFENGLRQANASMLAVNQKVRITAAYNLQTKEWQINRISILDMLTLPTSPQGTQPKPSTPPLTPTK